MNITGISKVYFIKRSLCSLPPFFNPGSTLALGAYLSGSLTELDFDHETISLVQGPAYENGNEFYKVAASFIVSGIDNTKHELISRLSGEPYIFVFGDNEGKHFLCGTNTYRVRFNFKLSHISPPNSARNYQIEITHSSPHGLVFCSIPA